MTPPKLTPALQDQITAALRAGAFPHIAAEAWGVSRTLFELWLRRGEKANAREPYRSFARATRTAKAQARLRAEMTVFAEAPKVWLEHGPGREEGDAPGWTSAAKPRSTLAARQPHPFMDDTVRDFMRIAETHLGTRSEALSAIAQDLELSAIGKHREPPHKMRSRRLRVIHPD